MSLKIYNSLTKKKQDFVPLQGKHVRIYSCGVTVYDKCHIGHARSLYAMEVIRRYLRYRGYEVHFVRNITDVDDKIINKARETGKTFEEVVKENVALYEQDLNSLGLPQADLEPRATENIGLMIEHIQKLINNEFAYEIQGDVYFHVRKFKDYGRLSGQSVEKMLEAVRISRDENKKDPLDFALWKKSKEGEPAWPSPWGPGRPGWHIECSCMSMKHLGTETLDIHAGGQDLIFPHHENEIAQSEALTGKPFARYWIHNGLLTINGQKMAKSLGNFITVEDALKRHSPDDLKFFFLTSHYKSAIDFNPDKMAEGHKELERFDIFLRKAKELGLKSEGSPIPEPGFLERHKSRFMDAMDDDFNTPKAVGVLNDLVSESNRHEGKKDAGKIFTSSGNFVLEMLQKIFMLFDPKTGKMSPEAQSQIEQLLRERLTARAAGDFKRSDELRALLKQKGAIVEDTKDGQKWRPA